MNFEEELLNNRLDEIFWNEFKVDAIYKLRLFNFTDPKNSEYNRNNACYVVFEGCSLADYDVPLMEKDIVVNKIHISKAMLMKALSRKIKPSTFKKGHQYNVDLTLKRESQKKMIILKVQTYDLTDNR